MQNSELITQLSKALAKLEKIEYYLAAVCRSPDDYVDDKNDVGVSDYWHYCSGRTELANELKEILA